MKNQIKTISERKLRRIIADMVEDITAGAPAIRISARGNTFNIHLADATINIHINEHPATAQKGGLQ